MYHRNALKEDSEFEGYIIKSVLGHGGFGITYLAKDKQLDQLVAIKEYLPSELAVRSSSNSVCAKSEIDEDAFNWGLQRFILEARTLARFKHPNIVRVLRFFERNNTAYMVMEYQEGQSLSDLLKGRNATEKELISIVLPLLDGLQEVHVTGFLHRDIKPNNIFILKDGTPMLLDFGAARYAIGQKSSSLTSIVTPGYAPFEQYDSRSVQGAWTDIYSMGAVMYYAISGKPPDEVVTRLKDDKMPRAIDIGKDKYRSELLKAIDWALALDEDARPQSVAQWREALVSPPLQIMPAQQSRITTKYQLNTKLFQQNNISWIFILLSLIFGGYVSYTYLLNDNPAIIKEKISDEQINNFVNDYLRTLEGGNVANLIKYYARQVNYYDLGTVSNKFIFNEKTNFYKKWPKVKYIATGKIDRIETDVKNEITVMFYLDFIAENPIYGDVSSGHALQHWRLRNEITGLKIIEEKQKIFHRDKKNNEDDK
jgi:serine/threonine protein kinase